MKAKKFISFTLAFALMLALFTFIPASVGATGDFWSTITAGQNYTLAIKNDGSLWAWGRNASGQLGDGTTTDKHSPTKIMDGVAQVSAGGNHTMAIKNDGSLWAWGGNLYEQLGDGTKTDRHSPKKIMDGVSQVSAGTTHTAAIKNDGSLWVWGRNASGQLGDGTTENRSSPTKIMDGVSQVSVGGNHTMAIKNDGSLWAWGSNWNSQLGDGTKTDRRIPTKIMDGVSQVSAGSSHTLVIKNDGSLWAWGKSGFGVLGDGTTEDRQTPVKIMDGVLQVSTDISNTFAIKNDSSLWGWGENNCGQLGDGTTKNNPNPVKIMEGVAQVSAGISLTMAIKNDGSVWACGQNNYGQLGDGTTTHKYSPVKIADGEIIPPITKYTVTVSSAGTGASGGGSYGQGETVNIKPGTPPTGKQFKNWTTTSAGVNFANANSANTSFAMPESNVTVTAVFEDNLPTFTQNDRYSFGNSRSNFGDTYTVSDNDFKKLSDYVKKEYNTSYANSVINSLQQMRNSYWDGSCYGMAATAILDKNKQINMKSIVNPAAANLWALPSPNANSRIKSTINYYAISQKIRFLHPYYYDKKASDWSVGLQRLVQDAKNGKLIFFCYYFSEVGHAIVICGYEAGSNGSHNLIAYDNRYPNRDVIVNVSGNYQTCIVNGYENAYGVEFMSGDEMDIFDRINIQGNVNSPAVSSNLSQTDISVLATQSVTVKNKSGQTLIYNAQTGEISGTMAISGRHMIINSTADGSPAPATLVFTVPNSDQFTFETDSKGLDISVMNDSIFASAESDKADTVIVAKNEGVSVLGSGAIDFAISLGLNNEICDMVSLDGNANQGASLKYNSKGAVAHGNFNENTKLTIFSDTTDMEQINFTAQSNEVLITKQAGEIDVMFSSKNNGIFDVSALGDVAPESYWDIFTSDWYYSAVMFVHERGLMIGMDTGLFAPDEILTREQAITIIARLSGDDYLAYSGQTSFADIAPDRWSGPAIAWARSTGVTNGVGDNRFDPESDVTLDQFEVMLMRHFGVREHWKGNSTSCSRANAANLLYIYVSQYE